MKSRFAPAVALICTVVCAFTGSLPWAVAERLVAQPGNDGVWCRYDAHGELVERQIDTNGDGRPDVAEYYGHGALLRRASDRNFNGVTDLVEDFDADTQEPVRSIVDQDYDGTADLLVLFRDGRPVVAERASAEPASAERESPTSVGAIGGSSAAGLVALRNPFAGAAAIDSPVGPTPHETWIGVGRADALLVSFTRVSTPAPVAAVPPRVEHAALTAHVSLRSPRGPPQA